MGDRVEVEGPGDVEVTEAGSGVASAAFSVCICLKVGETAGVFVRSPAFVRNKVGVLVGRTAGATLEGAKI